MRGSRERERCRDFAPQECALRNYLFDTWRRVAHRYGFVEWEAPTIESTELYLKKSGGELPTQLFRFTDQGERDITVRPELKFLADRTS